MTSPRPIFTPSPYDTSTVGVPWRTGYTGPQTTTRSVGQPAQTRRPRFISTENGIAEAPSNWSDEDVAAYVQMWDAKVKEVTAALAASSGWERERKRLELADALKGRENAYKIAELQSQTSRYGTDKSFESNMAQLTENARQFDADHGLNQQKFGLDLAKAYTEYASGPDTLFMMNDFREGLGRAQQGLGPTPYGTQGTPQARGWEDFAALSGFGDVPAVQSGQSAQMTANQGGGPGQSGANSDPRVKAAMGIIKAIPPSDGTGHDDDNYAALDAIESVFRASLPGSYERMRPGQKKAFAAGLSRKGYYAPDAISQMRRNAPGQRAASMA